MSSRKSPLSLKARAIALLAQREHSVAELRRKLLLLAQGRDLRAWEEAHGVEHRSASQDGRDAAPELAQQGQASRAGVGSFDLPDDWGEGELDAFLDDWTESVPDAGEPRAPDLPTHPVPARQQEPFRHAPLPTEAPSPRASRTGADRRPSKVRRPPSPLALAAVMEDDMREARLEEVENLLMWLQERDYLSEVRLVESRINARASRYGNLRIRQELRQLGVVADEEQQAQLRDSEFDRAREVWQRKFGGVLPDDATSRARQMRFLAARGFSAEVVRRVLRAPDE